MNKVSLFFAVLRAYHQARAKEATTLRGAITGTLAAAAIFWLWYIGVDLTADQIGMVILTITGLDSVLKIGLPDQLGSKDNGKKNAAQNIGHTDHAGADPDPAHGADRLRQLPANGGPREDSGANPATR